MNTRKTKLRTVIRAAFSYALVVALLTSLPSSSEGAESDSYWLFQSNRRQAGTVLVNGFPLRESAGTNSYSTTTLLEPYIFAGENLIVVQSTDLATNVVLNDPNLIHLKLDYGSNSVPDRQLVFILEREYTLAETNSVESISITAPDLDALIRGRVLSHATRLEVNMDTRVSTYRILTSAPPHLIEIRTTLPLARLASLPWTGLPVTPSSADRAEIAALVQSMYTSLTNRDYTTFFQLTATKNQRMAQAASQTLGERQAASQQFFENLRSQPGFAFDALNTAGLSYQTYPDVNLVQVQVAGQPPIQATATGLRFKLPVFVSKLSGVWVCVD